MKVLVACEFSGVVRDAFLAKGHDAWSCDFEESDSQKGPHYVGDVRELLYDSWDLMVAFPPCDHLAISGARWFPEKIKDGRQHSAIMFVKELMEAPIDRIAIENPVGILSTRIRKPDQYIQPWQFGHGETKKTCLWLKNLPLLQPTNVVEGRSNRIHMMPGGKRQAKRRSIMYPGIAAAMAEQWGEEK